MVRMKSYILLSFLVAIQFSMLYAQQQTQETPANHAAWFKAIPLIDAQTPEWAVQMYRHSEDFVKVVEAYEQYYKTNPFEKTLHTQNYKHWKHIVEPYVEADGKVHKPSDVDIFNTYANRRAHNNRNTNIWNNIGPNRTYAADGSMDQRLNQANAYCLAVAPSNHSIVYVSTEPGSLFKSLDKGLTWEAMSLDAAFNSALDMKVDRNDPNTLYLGSGTGIYKSTDGAQTFDQVHVASGTIEQFLIDVQNGQIIYAATSTGLLKSMDAGASWTTIYTGQVYDIEAMPGSSDSLYISVKNDVAKRPEIYKSTNGGATWELKDNGFYSPSDLSVAQVFGCKIGVTPADPNRIYAGIIASGKTGDNGWIGVYYSTDGGETWQEDSGFDGAPYASGNDVNTNWYVAGYASGYHQGWYNFDLDVSHTNPDKFWIGTIWFCESANKGANFEYIRGTRGLNMHADIQDIDVVGDEIWVCSDGGVNFSNDSCHTMDIRMNGIYASNMWEFGQGWNEDVYVGGRYHNGDVAYHENYGLGNTLFLGGAESPTGYVNQMENKKTHFKDITDRLLPDSLNIPNVNMTNLGMYPTSSYIDFASSEVEWHPYHANKLFLGKGKVFYSSQNGGSSFDTLHVFNGDVRKFEISRDDPNVIYCIVKESTAIRKIYRTEDGGQNFVEISTPPYNSGNWQNLSFTLNPFDKNEIWVASNTSSNGNKIFSSVDGGQTWTNRYDMQLEGEKIMDLLYHASDEGDIIYCLTRDGFFYYDKDAASWQVFDAGLPALHRGFKMLPFYRDKKIRLATSKGIWEAEFIRKNKTQVMPYVMQDSVFCGRDTIALECHSIVNHAGALWSWNIMPSPSYISNANIRNPKIVLDQEGDYSIALSIEQNGQTITDTFENVITLNDKCKVDSTAGNSLKTLTNGDYMVAQNANLSNLTHFTVSGWWKPDGSQQGFSALFSSGDWCAHCDYTEGLIISYFGDKLWYKWPGNSDNWGSNSGLVIPIDEWSHVALVIEPTQATLYLNEQKYVHVKDLNPGEFNNIFIGYGHYSKSFKGEIDEVAMWSRALNEDEIRLLRHRILEIDDLNDPALIAYYQFNQSLSSGLILDKAHFYHGTIQQDAYLTTSTAPVGIGVSEQHTITGPGLVDFGATGLSLLFPQAGPYPDGDVVVTRIGQLPDSIPFAHATNKAYFVINNYGSNETFNAIEEISIQLAPNASILASGTSLSSRASNAHLNNWTVADPEGDEINLSTDRIVFNQNLNINSAQQLYFTPKFVWIGEVNSDWDNPLNWSTHEVPILSSDVLIPAGKAYYPVVDKTVNIHTLEVREGAALYVQEGTQFHVITD